MGVGSGGKGGFPGKGSNSKVGGSAGTPAQRKSAGANSIKKGADKKPLNAPNTKPAK